MGNVDKLHTEHLVRKEHVYHAQRVPIPDCAIHVFKYRYSLKMAMLYSRNMYKCFGIQKLVQFDGDKFVYWIVC
jgi:hypothetical protein